MEFRCVAVDRGGPGPLSEIWEGDTLVVGLFTDAAGGGRGLVEELVGDALEGWLRRHRFEEDTYGERDFGAFTFRGERVFFKIDYYDLNLEYGSEDPADASITARVVTIMLATEY